MWSNPFSELYFKLLINLTFWIEQVQWQELVGVVLTHFTDKPLQAYMRRFAKLLLKAWIAGLLIGCIRV